MYPRIKRVLLVHPLFIPIFLKLVLNEKFRVYIYSVYIFIPSIIFAILSPATSLLIVVTQIRGRIAGSSTPLPPTTVRAWHFYREKTSALCCLVDSRRTLLTQAIGVLSSCCLWRNKSSIFGAIGGRTYSTDDHSVEKLYQVNLVYYHWGYTRMWLVTAELPLSCSLQKRQASRKVPD